MKSEICFSVTDISVERIFKLWLQPDILFRWSPRYNEYKKSLLIIENVAQNVSTKIFRKSDAVELKNMYPLTIFFFQVIKSKRKKIESNSHSPSTEVSKKDLKSSLENSVDTSKWLIFLEYFYELLHNYSIVWIYR